MSNFLRETDMQSTRSDIMEIQKIGGIVHLHLPYLGNKIEHTKLITQIIHNNLIWQHKR